ncbi:hypothetical protein [Salinicola peritrichatus]|uniref:hypothetical protein n=1 Tax=Salinicola peritrichatus TaxID=1267424 RepID=UPI000DA1EC43|nr:hypothetical protein [Salinicola peritrichatus]
MKVFIKRLEFDGLVSLIFVLLSIAAFFYTYGFNHGAGAWPRAMILLFGVLSAAIVVGKFVKQGESQ